MGLQTLSRCICHFCLSLQLVWGSDTVALLNPPEEPLPDHLLAVSYSCDEPATVQLDCVVSFQTGATSTFLLRRWTCVPGGARRRRTVRLTLPDWLVYRADGVVPDSQWVLTCVLRASVRRGGSGDARASIAAQDVATLQPKPSFSRPAKRHRVSAAWSSSMLQFRPQLSKSQCPVEKETAHLLTSIFASTGESFGVTKTLRPYNSEVLEYLRVQSVSFPWCAFSMWVFVTRRCRENLCGLLHHIGSHHDYATPALFLTNSGQLHVQMRGESEESSAFLSPFTVPLSEWCRLSLGFHGRTVTISMVCLEREHRTVHSAEHTFSHVALDDTDGYFVIGGGKYVRGAEGYFGPSVYYRNRIPADSPPEVVLPDVIRRVDLAGWQQACQQFTLRINLQIDCYLLEARRSESCFDAFHTWMAKDRRRSACELREPAAPHERRTARLLKLLAFKHKGRGGGGQRGGGGGPSLPAVARALFSLSLHKLGKASSTQVFSSILPLLLQAGCLSDSRALHTSSVLYSAGLGVRRRPDKAWLLALLAARTDHRLALLRLGHLHQRGLHGVPADPDVAYAYYANIAEQTNVDRHNPSPQQTYVEAVYLNNEEALKLQTNEDHHIFQWLKLQARRGAAEAEQTIARMLYWGQQGLSPNIQGAVRHYERGAVQWEDPVSMYDYGIILMQGHGVEKDVPKAVTFLKKAKDQGFVPAMSALAWYYEQFEQDYERAVQLWEQADRLGSPDAALNLGVMHARGLYPGRSADQHTAYRYYLKSAQRGHVKGAILLADIWTTGIPGSVIRRPSDAVLWAKWAAEHNGYLGSVLRRALDSYLKSDMLGALLYYATAAESGYAAAQFNLAYICEQNAGGFVDADFALDCVRTYYNQTIQSQSPDTYAFIRMGDLWYGGQVDGQKDLFSAAQMYKLAARQNDPQGWYNLGLLAEEGYRLPLSVLIELGLSEFHLADSAALQTALYQRCRDSEDTDSYLPCSLALFNVYLQLFQKDYGAAIKHSAASAAVAVPTILLIILGVLRRRVLSLN